MSTKSANGGRRSLRLNESVARELGIAILSGKYQPGEALSKEMENSAEFGVSRTPYREALRILAAKGLIEARPKTGTRVTPKDRWNLLDPDILAWMFSNQPDPTFVRDLFELRHVIEPTAAAFAAERRTDDHVRELELALAGMREHGLSSAEGQAADRQFHRVLLEASGNSLLVTLSGSIGAAVQWTTYFKQTVHSSPRNPLPDHEVLCEAVVAGDPEAARLAMSELLRLALQDMGPI